MGRPVLAGHGFGGGAATRITYIAAGSTRPYGTVAGGAGSMTVNAAGGAFLGGSDGNNHITATGNATMAGGGAGDVLAAVRADA